MKMVMGTHPNKSHFYKIGTTLTLYGIFDEQHMKNAASKMTINFIQHPYSKKLTEMFKRTTFLHYKVFVILSAPCRHNQTVYSKTEL